MKTKLFLLITMSCIFFYGSAIGQTPMQDFHKKVLPIFKRSTHGFGAYNRLDGGKDKKSIKIFASKDRYDWIKIYESNDTLFSFQFYGNIHDLPKVVCISNKDADLQQQCLMILAELLPAMVGYDTTLQMLSPFFDKKASEFYFAELKKAEKKMKDIMFTGQPGIIEGFPDRNSGGKGKYNYLYNGPGRWMLDITQDSGSILFGAPFMCNGDFNSLAHICISDVDVSYTCGVFGCTIELTTKDGWIHTPISLEEFKTHYALVF